MKKSFWQVKAIAFAAAVLFCIPGGAFFAGCSSDSDGGSDTPTENSEKIENSDGTTTLKIEENGKGFVSTTGSVNSSDTKWIGYSGGYIENLIKGTTVVYTVKAESAISDAKIAIHYANWQNTNVRGAYVYVNGTLINEDKPISLTYTNKGTQATVVSDRWIDSGYLTGVSLNAGSNTIIIEGAPAATYSEFIPTEKDTANSLTSLAVNNDGQLSNIDYLVVNGKGIDYGTDTTKYVTLSAASENETAGSVESSVTAASVAEGTSATLTATANSGWKFQCWSDGSTSNPYTKTISESTYIFAHFIPEGYTAPAESDGYMGYATVTSDSAAGYTISGGAGGKTIEISTLADLTTYASELSGSVPYIVKFTNATRITTTGNASSILSIGSNKTVYGAAAGAGLKNIEMRVSGDNVIIRNLVLGEVIAYDTYGGSGNDALSLNGATHVWVDHCEFKSNTTPYLNDGTAATNSSNDEDFAKDFYDGLLDVKNGATWITVSNCYFHDHYKAVLCASGDDGPDSSSRTGLSDSDMRVTFNGNYFKNVNARMPLFRYGTGHILNSYFDAGTFSGEASCINVRAGSKLYIEGNYFSGIKSTDYTIGFYYADSSKTYGSTSGSWTAVNNSSANGSGGSSSVSAPAYSYTKPSSYPSSAPTNAGATLTSLSY
ncbi:MAG: hypothetical protein IJ717_05100 [Treponema sp.]|nr:hypothetical protein [Treponema sp.]